MRHETIENYLKTIYNLSSNNTAVVSNQKIAVKLDLNPATVTEGLKKLHELKYIVYEKLIVKPDDVSVIKGDKSDSILTLVTCTPIYIASHRLIIHARLEETILLEP